MPSRWVPTWLWLSQVSSMYVSWFSPNAAPGASDVAVRIVFVNRLPKRGIPSVSGYDITMTLPSLISAAAALVTAGVTRLVAPVSSFGPHGEGGTMVLQSLWAAATEAHPRSTRNTTSLADANLMDGLLSWGRKETDGNGNDAVLPCYS